MTDFLKDPEAAALHRRILECPADDAPRLIISDWLEENGRDARAEFIRVQIELAKTPKVKYPAGTVICGSRPVSFARYATDYNHSLLPTSILQEDLPNPRYEELAEREETLFKSVPRLGVYDAAGKPLLNLATHLMSHMMGTSGWAVLSRGFVSEVRLSMDDFLGVPHCKRCSGEGCSAYGVAANGPCVGQGVESLAKRIFESHPVEAVTLTDARIFWSGGNMTCYVGNLGRFPREYWKRLEGHDTERAAKDALSVACVDLGRELAGIDPDA